MAKVTRKNIIATIINSEDMINTLANTMGVGTDDVKTTLNKWDVALSKSSANKNANKNDEFIIAEIVPFVTSQPTPVTAKMVNDNVVKREKTNQATVMLRRAVEMGLLSRDKVRKNASFEYAEPEFDWNAYIDAYDAKVKDKQSARIAKARANRN